MSRSRRLFVNLMLVGMLGASAHDIVRDEEHWPFSQYPMFNRVTEKQDLTWLRMYGVGADGTEFPLLTHLEVFPFDQSRLSKSLGSVRQRPDAAAQIHAAIVNCLDRYERLRLQGRHEGRAAARMRLYEVKWTLHPTAANLDTPDSRTLLGEASL